MFPPSLKTFVETTYVDRIKEKFSGAQWSDIEKDANELLDDKGGGKTEDLPLFYCDHCIEIILTSNAKQECLRIGSRKNILKCHGCKDEKNECTVSEAPIKIEMALRRLFSDEYRAQHKFISEIATIILIKWKENKAAPKVIISEKKRPSEEPASSEESQLSELDLSDSFLSQPSHTPAKKKNPLPSKPSAAEESQNKSKKAKTGSTSAALDTPAKKRPLDPEAPLTAAQLLASIKRTQEAKAKTPTSSQAEGKVQIKSKSKADEPSKEDEQISPSIRAQHKGKQKAKPSSSSNRPTQEKPLSSGVAPLVPFPGDKQQPAPALQPTQVQPHSKETQRVREGSTELQTTFQLQHSGLGQTAFFIEAPIDGKRVRLEASITLNDYRISMQQQTTGDAVKSTTVSGRWG